MIVDQLPALRRLPEHRRLLEQAVALFREDARVVGLVVGGSLAHDQADFYSDVDRDTDGDSEGGVPKPWSWFVRSDQHERRAGVGVCHAPS